MKLDTGVASKSVSTGVVSSEIQGKIFLEIYSNHSGNLLVTYVSQLFSSPALQSDVVK